MHYHGTKHDLTNVQILVEGTAQLFRWWHKLRDGEIARRGFCRCMASLRERMEDALAALAEDGSPKRAGKAD